MNYTTTPGNVEGQTLTVLVAQRHEMTGLVKCLPNRKAVLVVGEKTFSLGYAGSPMVVVA